MTTATSKTSDSVRANRVWVNANLPPASGASSRDAASGRDRRLWRGSRSLVVPLVIFIVWQAIFEMRVVSPTLLPSAWQTTTKLLSMIVSGDIWPDLKWTGLRVIAGFGLATIVGVALGLTIGVYRGLYDIMVPPIDFFRSIPVTILYPVFVLVLGISHSSKIGMVFFGSVFVIALNTAYGVVQASPMRAQMARLFGASPAQVLRWVTFFEALPQTMIGLRIALSLSLVVEVLCEMFMGSEFGLGQRVSDAFTTYAIVDMYALIIFVGIFGFALNRGFVRVEHHLIPWSAR